MELNSKNIKKILFIITITLLLMTIFRNLAIIIAIIGRLIKIFFPVILGLCIAFALNILMRFYEQRLFIFIKDEDKKLNPKRKATLKSLKRGLSLTLSVLSVAAVIGILSLVILPQIAVTFNSLALNLPSHSEIILNKIISFLNSTNLPIERISAFEINWNKLFELLAQGFMKGSNSLLNTATELTTSILGAVFNFILAFIIALYVLMQKEKIQGVFLKLMKAFLPKKINLWIEKIASVSYTSFSNFITGQLIEAIILGLLCFVGMLIFKLPYANVIPVIIGVTALIPIFGAWIGGGISAFLILMINPVKALFFIAFILILQQLEGNLIYPKVVGKSVGLPGLLVLIAVIVGGDLGGVVGIIFSVPVCSVCYTILMDIVDNRLNTRNN